VLASLIQIASSPQKKGAPRNDTQSVGRCKCNGPQKSEGPLRGSRKQEGRKWKTEVQPTVIAKSPTDMLNLGKGD